MIYSQGQKLHISKHRVTTIIIQISKGIKCISKRVGLICKYKTWALFVIIPKFWGPNVITKQGFFLNPQGQQPAKGRAGGGWDVLGLRQAAQDRGEKRWSRRASQKGGSTSSPAAFGGNKD